MSSYLDGDFKNLILSSEGPAEILCTFDACTLQKAQSNLSVGSPEPVDKEIRVKIGLNPGNLNRDTYLFLYYFISRYNYVSFDFYENSNFRYSNMIVVKGKAALMCSLDHYGKIAMLSVINDPEKVDVIYSRINSLFKIHHLLIMSTTSDELVSSGYRSNFYAFSNYQIFLSRGFEYLLPPEIIDNIVEAAYRLG